MGAAGTGVLLRPLRRLSEGPEVSEQPSRPISGTRPTRRPDVLPEARRELLAPGHPVPGLATRSALTVDPGVGLALPLVGAWPPTLPLHLRLRPPVPPSSCIIGNPNHFIPISSLNQLIHTPSK